MSTIVHKPRLRLRLYVAGAGTYSERAARNLEAFALAAGLDYDLETVDLRKEPQRAAADAVVVTPTLIKLAPAPRAMVIGDLSDTQRLANALGAAFL